MKTISSLSEIKAAADFLARIGAEPRSLLKAVVTEPHGNYWIDKAIIKFDKMGNVETPVGWEPTTAERELIKAAFAEVKWPETVHIPLDAKLPKMISDADPQDIFYFHDTNGNIVMMQLRVERKGERSYIPFTLWDDGEFRCLEPEGQLPLYGLDRLKDYKTVIIHEGAKAARMGQEIAEGRHPDHPWATELSNACHLGFIGGALSPHRTDWDVLKKKGISRAYIVADNDTPGMSSIPKIAKELNCITFSIEFSDEFPVSFDLADPFPDHFFRQIEDKRFYIGPTFRQCQRVSTYMTNIVPVQVSEDKVKDIPVLRNHVKNLWTFVEDSDLFVCSEMPEIMRKAELLDKMHYPFAETKKLSELLHQNFTGKTTKLAYKPGTSKRRIITSDGEPALNLYVPSNIKPQDGDPQPFLDYMNYLFPVEKECYEVQKWLATLIAKPEIKMLYALLLISEQTGTGKTTLGERIAAPIVGEHNTSYPSEEIILGQFNAWAVKKRLAVVGEIYQGHSFKAANKLKQYLTDGKLTLREMYQNPITFDNYLHVIANSNSLNALRIEEHDRRWFVPVVTEERWSDEQFDQFFDWLDSGGLSIITAWAHKFGDYVKTGAKAPSSRRKSEMIEAGRSEAVNHVTDLGRYMADNSQPLAVGDVDILNWVRAICEDKVYDKKNALKKIMLQQGLFSFGTDQDRIWLKRGDNGTNQYIIVNRAARDIINKYDDSAERKSVCKSMITMPFEIVKERND
jgi:DNA polymerase III delta prime subunit